MWPWGEPARWGAERGGSEHWTGSLEAPAEPPLAPVDCARPPGHWKHYEKQPEQSPMSLHLDSALDLRRGSFLRPR